MSNIIINTPSFINGVLYSCRTCFDPGNPIFSLKEECVDTKTWRDLLRDTSEEDSFPNTICCKCLDKLIKFYDFMIQIKNVDKKYQKLLTISIESDEEVEESCKINDSFSDSLMDSDTDMPMEEFISESKGKKEQITPCDIVLNNNENDRLQH